MASINNISVDGFKTLFKRDFPYLPVWKNGIVYFKGDIVFYNNNFYQSTIDNNTSIPDEANSYYTKKEVDEIVENVQSQVTENTENITSITSDVDEIKILPTYDDLEEMQ